MKWVTHARPKTDRIACPWLIRRFIDPDAEILYVPKQDVLGVARDEQAHSFDAPGAEFDHRDGRCTFEVLIDHFGLDRDPALVRLAAIVHAADIDTELHTDPLGPGLLAIGLGGLDVEADDHRLLERASFVYDALYAWSAQQAIDLVGVIVALDYDSDARGWCSRRDYRAPQTGRYERCSCLSPSDYRARVIAHDEGARRGAPRPCRRSGVRLTA